MTPDKGGRVDCGIAYERFSNDEQFCDSYAKALPFLQDCLETLFLSSLWQFLRMEPSLIMDSLIWQFNILVGGK